MDILNASDLHSPEQNLKFYYKLTKELNLGKWTEFDISRERSEALYQSGREAAKKFFDTWNFSEYIDKYRRGKPRIDRGLRLKSG